MKKRWISLYVENEIGVLAKISGLFSGKAYNLNSLTVGETEDPTVSRMTISLTSDDLTFEQIKKQLNRSVEVIKVVDYTDIPIHKKELMFIKAGNLSVEECQEIFRIAEVFRVRIKDYGKNAVILECLQTENRNSDLMRLLAESFGNRIEVVRGGSVAIEAVSMSER
ncbi:acetolactate synthase small subunit [Diplocloster hominis]|uniref:acetolactate synthase small subunit n=1 Tax=Diplocloster hominis TaxID=3079010 RepID=UPI0031BA3F43